MELLETTFKELELQDFAKVLTAIITYTNQYGIDFSPTILADNKQARLFLLYSNKPEGRCLAGFCYGFDFPTLFSKDTLFFTDFIYIFEDFRGEGLHDILIEAIKERCKAKTTFRVLDSNPIKSKFDGNKAFVNITSEIGCSYYRDR